MPEAAILAMNKPMSSNFFDFITEAFLMSECD